MCEAYCPADALYVAPDSARTVAVDEQAHPNTGRARDDHVAHALWLGAPLGVREEALSNEPGDDTGNEIVPNTHPQGDDDMSPMCSVTGASAGSRPVGSSRPTGR